MWVQGGLSDLLFFIVIALLVSDFAVLVRPHVFAQFFDIKTHRGVSRIGECCAVLACMGNADAGLAGVGGVKQGLPEVAGGDGVSFW